MRRLPILFFAAALSTASWAAEVAVAPTVDASALPPLGATWRESNPYRGLPAAVAVGQSAYHQACARCHGVDAATHAAPAPDLRKLDRACRRIADAALQAHCMADNDAYFAKSVRHGKLIVGVTHMPPWEGVLPQEVAWAIQVFVDARAREAQ